MEHRLEEKARRYTEQEDVGRVKEWEADMGVGKVMEHMAGVVV